MKRVLEKGYEGRGKGRITTLLRGGATGGGRR